MRTKLITLSSFFLMVGCSQKVAPPTIIHTTDTVITVIPDTVYIPIEDNSFDFDIADLNHASDTLVYKNKKGSVSVHVEPNGKGTIICMTDSLRAVIEHLRIQINDTTAITRTITVEVKYTPVIWKIGWGIALTELLLLLFAIYRMFKK